MFSVLKFLSVTTVFITATAASVCYETNTAQINLWLALALMLGLNQPKLNGKKFAIAGLTALISALTAVILPAHIWNVWLFAFFMMTVYMLSEKKFTNGLIYVAAFFNLLFITNTAYTDVQYDFASCYNYIEYILENNFMFWKENPLLTRPSYSTYHPILHFFLASGIIRIAQFFTANSTAAAEAVQVLFCSYMLWYYIIAAKILRLLNAKKFVYCAGLAFICFFPMYNAIAGFFNNDCLLLPLQAGAVYYALLYYRDGGRKNLFYIWLFAVMAALTKLSGVLILPMVAAALGMRLWKHRNKTIFNELLVFGLCLLLGCAVWPLYQHFVLELPAGFVPPQEHLSLKTYGLWERFNPLGAVIYEKMFYNDFGVNLWETMTKTALFGQWDFSLRGADIMELITLVVWLYKGILCITTGIVLYLLFTQGKSPLLWLTLFLLAGLLIGQVLFGLMHPYMCNQDFRYVALLPLPIAMIWITAADRTAVSLLHKIQILLYGFALSATVIWWYVGAVRL